MKHQIFSMVMWCWTFLNKLRMKVIYIQNMDICELKTGKNFLWQRSQITQKEHLGHRHGAEHAVAVLPLFMRKLRQAAKNWCKNALIWNIYQAGLQAIAQVKDMANINCSWCNKPHAFAPTNWTSTFTQQTINVRRTRLGKLSANTRLAPISYSLGSCAGALGHHK